MACGLIISLLLGLAAAQVIEAEGPGYGGPGYTVTSNGLQIDGIQPNNPRNRVILDNDMFHEDPGWLILSAMHKLGRVDLKGIIITHEPNPQGHLNGGIKPWPTAQVNDYNRMRGYALESGLSMMTHTLGAGTMLVRPESGKIDDTQYTSTPGSQLIIQQAEASAPDNPLLVFVGGQATTVATALLEKPSIANRMIVIYAGSFPRSYNTYDSWAAYVTVMRASLVDLAQEPWNDVRHAGGLEPGVFDAWPDNAIRRYIEPTYYRSDWMAYCDSPAIIWLFDQSLITGANRRNVTGLSLNVPTPWPTDGNDTINSQQVSTSFYGYLDIRRSDRRAHEVMRSWTALVADPRVWDPDYTGTTPPPSLGLRNASGTRQQGDSLDATRYVAESSFLADTMHARFTSTSASGVMRMAIYADNDGAPGAVLGDTAEFDAGPGLRSAALKDAVEITEGSVYWIATWMQRDSTTNVTFVANDGAGTRFRAEPTYGATASFPSGSTLSHSANVTYAVFATGTED
jgi:hypothetical protein